ncbi:MAG TPA: CHAT domain-containing protein [Thermoanaerobaculia bacterium]|nr:CHAT domain-containing protein [Thermoanaerobaculia bacterium]
MPPADLEIRIRLGREEGLFPVEVSSPGDREFPAGRLDARGLLPWVPSPSSEADGERLFGALFADPPVAAAWAEMAGEHPQRRIHLRIDAEAGALHALPWELLRAPGASGPDRAIAADAATPFSRFLASDRHAGLPVLERPLRLLALISAPRDLPSHLPALSFDEERNAFLAALGEAAGEIEVTFLEPPVSLARIEEALRSGPHVLHLIAHGEWSARRESAALYLADEAGSAVRVLDAELAAMIARLAVQPRLIFLASCQTAVTSPADAFRGLAPRLVAAGVPAVIGMQDLLPLDTARAFTGTFYRRVMEHGFVDLAANEARSQVTSARLEGAAVPVLFLRLRDGRLLGRPGRIEGREPDVFWRALVDAVREGRCTPLIGWGAHAGVLPSPEEAAERLAPDDYPYPDRHDLPRVAQFLGLLDSQLPHRHLLALSASRFRRHYRLPDSAAEPGATISEIARSNDWSSLCRDEGSEIHHGLAALGLPIYLTTNFDGLMTLALESQGRTPQRAALSWREDPQSRSSRSPERVKPPSSAAPVVFHLFGTDDDLDSMVLTEDEHLDYLAAISRAEDNLLPSSIAEALARSTLLFLGYRLHQLDLKILLRGFLARLDSPRWLRRLQVAVQIDPEESDPAALEAARAYTAGYLANSQIAVYWGSPEQFIAELGTHLAEKRHD